MRATLPCLLLALMCAACGDSSRSPSAPGGEPSLIRYARYLAVTLDGECPPQVVASFYVEHGMCEELSTPEVTRDGPAFVVTVTTRSTQPPGQACPAIGLATPFSVAIGSGFEPGTYGVVVPLAEGRSVTETFVYPACEGP